MVITLGNIVFGGKGNGGGKPAAYVVPDGMNFGYSKLTEFPFDDFDFSQKTNFSHCWMSCYSLTEFPQINTSKGTDFDSAWYRCSSLKSFPQLDLHNGTNFSGAWYYCSSLTEFPMLDLSKSTNFTNAWRSCGNLTTLGGFGAIKESIDLSASNLLTVDSMMNVINQAANLNELGITGKTMTLGSTNLTKLTDEQKAVATNKGWTLA